MAIKKILMMTKNDKTVPLSDWANVVCSFENLNEKIYGFKDVCVDGGETLFLADILKYFDKEIAFEVVGSGDEEYALRMASLASDIGVNYFLGTQYSGRVHERLDSSGVEYFPFLGRAVGHPSKLEGSLDEMEEQSAMLEKNGVAGVNVLAYRHDNPEDIIDLVKRISQKGLLKTIVAGGINSPERENFVKEQIRPWGYTMGGALFDKKVQSCEPFISTQHSHPQLSR